MKKLVLALAFGLLGTAAIATSAMAQDKTVDLKLSIWLPPAHPLVPATKAWADDIAKESGGTIKTAIFPSEQLGKAFDHYDMARDGIADVANRPTASAKTSFFMSRFLRIVCCPNIPAHDISANRVYSAAQWTILSLPDAPRSRSLPPASTRASRSMMRWHNTMASRLSCPAIVPSCVCCWRRSCGGWASSTRCCAE